MKKVLIGTIIGGFMTVMGLVAPASATGSTPFTTPPPPPFTQALYGVAPNFFGGVAFAPNGDPLVDECAFGGSPLHRFDHTTTLPVTNGTSTLHPVTTESSNAGCGLTNHPNGALYTNTSAGVIKLDANTGAQLAGPFGPGGRALGIAVDPQTGNLAYVESDSTIGFVDPGFTTTGTLSTVTSGGFVDQIIYDPTGNYLFLSNRDLNALTILKRDGTLVQNVPLVFGGGPDGIAFHATAPTFVLTNNNDGSLTRFDFPGSDFTQTPTQSVFASGGFRGDMSQVGPDGCLYLTQAGTRYDDGTVTGQNSLVQICPGFAPPPGVGGGDVPVTNTCDRTITGDVPGSVVVSAGTTCLFKATVHGSMTVQSGAAASVLNSTVAGSFSASGAAGLTICNSHLSSVSITGSTKFVLVGDGGDGSSSCAGNTVSGSVNLARQQGGLELGGNTIAGSVIVQSNLAPGTPPGTPTEDAATEIEGNQLRSSLVCVSNTPAPVNDGHVNTVAGSRSGQCTGTF